MLNKAEDVLRKEAFSESVFVELAIEVFDGAYRSWNSLLLGW